MECGAVRNEKLEIMNGFVSSKLEELLQQLISIVNVIEKILLCDSGWCVLIQSSKVIAQSNICLKLKSNN